MAGKGHCERNIPSSENLSLLEPEWSIVTKNAYEVSCRDVWKHARKGRCDFPMKYFVHSEVWRNCNCRIILLNCKQGLSDECSLTAWLVAVKTKPHLIEAIFVVRLNYLCCLISCNKMCDFLICRWWPARICFPDEIPIRIQQLHHDVGEFPVMFFGSRDYCWLHAGRVFPYQEGDKGCKGSRTSGTHKIFEKGNLIYSPSWSISLWVFHHSKPKVRSS